MKSLNQWRESLEQQVTSQPAPGSSQANPLQVEKEAKAKKVNSDLTYLKYVFGKAHGKADPELVRDIKNKVGLAKERYAKGVDSTKGWIDLDISDQYEFMLDMMQAVMVASMPGQYKTGQLGWSQSKSNNMQRGAERSTPPQAPKPMEPPANMAV